MTTVDDIQARKDAKVYLDFIYDRQNEYFEFRKKSLDRINNILFTLNTGSLFGAITYIVTNKPNCSMRFSIWIFFTGIFLCVLHATIDYYISETTCAKYSKFVKQFYSKELTWEGFVSEISKIGNNVFLDTLLHVIGWISGLLFFIGLIIGLANI